VLLGAHKSEGARVALIQEIEIPPLHLRITATISSDVGSGRALSALAKSSPSAPAATCLAPPRSTPCSNEIRSYLKLFWLKKFGSDERICRGAHSRERNPSAFGYIEQ